MNGWKQWAETNISLCCVSTNKLDVRHYKSTYLLSAFPLLIDCYSLRGFTLRKSQSILELLLLFFVARHILPLSLVASYFVFGEVGVKHSKLDALFLFILQYV